MATDLYGILHIPTNSLVSFHNEANYDETVGISYFTRLCLGDNHSVPWLSTHESQAHGNIREEDWYTPWYKDYRQAQERGELKVVKISLTHSISL